MDREALKQRYPHSGSLFDTPDEDCAIIVDGLTKDYGKGRGVFDISLIVPKGKTMGYCGTNGAGKTTTLRHIMGFLKPQQGSVSVLGMDAWKQAQEIKPHVGYLPGEIAFPPLESGSEFLKLQAEMVGLTDMSRAEKIINSFQLDPTANMKRMSKGMKQKTAMVACFMHSPEIVILDEPTTGLDPLMREVFVNLIQEEKDKGTSIIMSNHMFDELEETCDYVAFIKKGKITDIVDVEQMINNRPVKNYSVRFKKKGDYLKVSQMPLKFLYKDDASRTCILAVDLRKIDATLKDLINYEIAEFHEIPYTLEQYFMDEVVKEKIAK